MPVLKREGESDLDKKNLFTKLLIAFLSLMFFGGLTLGIFHLLSSEGQQFPKEEPAQSALQKPETSEEVIEFIKVLVKNAGEEKAQVKKSYQINIDDESISVLGDNEVIAAGLKYIKNDLLEEFSKYYEKEEADFGEDFTPLLMSLNFLPESVAKTGSIEKGDMYELGLSFTVRAGDKNIEVGLEEAFETSKSKLNIEKLINSYANLADIERLEIKTESLALDCLCDRLSGKISRLTYTKNYSAEIGPIFKGELEKLNVKSISFTYQEKVNFEFSHIGLRLKPRELTLKKGDIKVINAYVTAGDKIEVLWRSTDEELVSVDEEGYVKAKKTSSAPTIIEAEFNYLGNTYKDSCEVYVTVPVKKVTLSSKRLDLKVGEENQLTAGVKPKDATIKDVLWFSEDEEVAKVDEKGRVKGIGVGETKIYVLSKDGYYRLSCKVRVNR